MLRGYTVSDIRNALERAGLEGVTEVITEGFQQILHSNVDDLRNRINREITVVELLDVMRLSESNPEQLRQVLAHLNEDQLNILNKMLNHKWWRYLMLAIGSLLLVPGLPIFSCVIGRDYFNLNENEAIVVSLSASISSICGPGVFFSFAEHMNANCGLAIKEVNQAIEIQRRHQP